MRHLHNWRYEQTKRFVADSITLGQFGQVYLQSVPDDAVPIRWAKQTL
jgi:hypothetical protein